MTVTHSLAIQVLLFGAVLGALFELARRIPRALKANAEASERFAGYRKAIDTVGELALKRADALERGDTVEAARLKKLGLRISEEIGKRMAADPYARAFKA